MNTAILGLLAETSIHPGSGQDAGFIDLPVAREAATDYPVIVGSSFKGALLDRARQAMDETLWKPIFGEQENSGALICSDVRLLLLPVRSLTRHYLWVTCPHLIERLFRDRLRAGLNGSASDSSIPAPEKGHYIGAVTGNLFLEERQFSPAESNSDGIPDHILQSLKSLIAHRQTRERLPNQTVIINDEDFAWFARYGLAVNARNQLDSEKKTSKNLWYEETIPPDSLFYTLLAQRSDGDALQKTLDLFKSQPYIQVGGNATVGQGWFAVSRFNSNGGEV